MPNYVSAFKNEYVLPPAKKHHAVCVDVIFHRDVKTQYGMQNQYELRWQSADRMEDGRRYLIRRSYNATLGEGSSLLKDLESWRARPFTQEELKRFDLDSCIGANAMITIQHEMGDKRMMDKVAFIEKADKNLPKLVPENYVRVKQQEPEGDFPEPPFTEEEVPF